MLKRVVAFMRRKNKYEMTEYDKKLYKQLDLFKNPCDGTVAKKVETSQLTFECSQLTKTLE